MARRSKRRKNTNTESADDVDKLRFARFTRQVIRYVAIGLGALFTFLQIKGLKPEDFITPVASDVLWRATLVIYYWCWIFGMHFDTNVQEEAYVSFPGKGRWPAQAFGALILFVGVAAVLLWTQGRRLYFAAALTAFFVVDHGMWFYLQRFLKRSIWQSRTTYNEQRRFFNLEILNTVDRQVMGPWKSHPMYAGAAIVVAIDLFAFVAPFREFLTDLASKPLFWLSSEEITNLLFTSLVLLFVVLMELWHWIKRLQTKLRTQALEDLKQDYLLEPRS